MEQVALLPTEDDSVETDSLYLDFDEAVVEEEAKPLTIKVRGREYELPATVTARLVLTQIKPDQTGSQVASVRALMEALVGKTNFEQMLDDGIEWTQLTAMSKKLLRHYGITSSRKDEEGDSKNPS